MPMILGYWDIR
uniref:Uncharacterized protein n=3 Tax=Amniota TaxID=32524 RepID=A0A8C6VJ67_NAJNA